ncbi:MAG: hypothetical protein K0U74_11105 [Alphaproteobacteria bacterium]|nr:hypothetical protein [Alphaproteobacteria bacterium]
MTMLIGVAAAILLSLYLSAELARRRTGGAGYALDDDPDLPKPFGYKMAWLAIRTEDAEAVAQSLGLQGGVASNWNSGIGTVYDDGLGASHVYLTPPVNGWTFVVGLSLPHPVGHAFVDKLTPVLLSLGTRFPEVQYFFTYPLVDFFAWARVKDGRLSRAFAVNDEGIVWNKGRISQEERALGLRLFEIRDVRERQGDAGGELVLYPTEDHVLQIAGGWSVNPTQLEKLSSADGRGMVFRAPSDWCSQRSRKRAA